MLSLLSNNCVSFVSDKLRKELGLLTVSVERCNRGRYNFLRTKAIHSGVEEWFLLKFTEEPYHTAEGGRSESFNVESLRQCNVLRSCGRNINKVLVCYKNGEVWMTDYLNFLVYGVKKVREFDNDSYVLNWNKKNDDGEALWKIIK